MASPLSVILEARGKKKNEITPTEGEDYTKEEVDDEETPDEPETNEEDSSDEPIPTDYTAEDAEEDTNDEPDTTDESDEELTPTDYTAEDPDGDEETGEGETDEESGDVEPTDYTAEDPDGDEGETGEETGDDPEPTDYTSDDPDGGEGETGEDTSTEPAPEGGALNEEDEKRKKKELFYDFTELYDLIKSFIGKLSSQANNTIFVNKILIQINKNLNDSRKAIWNYIIYEFDKNNYVTNLTKYNFFVENIRINIEMVHKVKDYLTKSETFK